MDKIEPHNPFLPKKVSERQNTGRYFDKGNYSELGSDKINMEKTPSSPEIKMMSASMLDEDDWEDDEIILRHCKDQYEIKCFDHKFEITPDLMDSVADMENVLVFAANGKPRRFEFLKTKYSNYTKSNLNPQSKVVEVSTQPLPENRYKIRVSQHLSYPIMFALSLMYVLLQNPLISEIL